MKCKFIVLILKKQILFFMKKQILLLAITPVLIALFLSSCSSAHVNKIPVRYNKYGPVHYMKYNVTTDGRILVKGMEVITQK